MTPKGNNKLAKANKPVVKTPVKSILKDTKSPARQNNKSVKIDSKVKVSQKKGKKKFEEEEEDDDDDDDIEQDIEDDNEADDDDNEVDEDDDNEINDEEEENDDDEEEEEDVINIPKNNKRKQEVQSTPSKKTKVEVNKNNKASSGTNRIFIRNISRQTEEKDLYQFLRNNGLNPIDVSVPRKPDGSSKGFGFAGFSNQNELEKAVALDGSELNGSTLSIAVSNDPRESQKTKTLLIKNLSSDVDEETLSSHFSGSTGCRIITYNGVSKGFGFVDFSSEAEAENALNQFQGTTINNQQIYVAYAQPKNSDRKPFNNNFGENNRQNSNNSFNNKRGGSNNRGNFRGGNRGNFRGGDRGNFRGGNRGGFKGNNRSHQKFDD